MDGSQVVGVIQEITETGYTIIDAQGVKINVEPRQIINEDNLMGVDNEVEVEYYLNGELKKGIVNDFYTERVEGFAYIDDQRIPLTDIVGVAKNEEVEDNAIKTTEETVENDPTTPVKVDKTTEEVPVTTETSYPVNEKRRT